ncbi:LysR family transcriptional regulator [Vibrio alginolyticus]|uniref:LysR family transcriptional regulator n=1 Tax=Vibrio alginolyticus TaxID=663 RepID=UPI0022DD7B04|nr:LysR family transcriptional regulator [Vibrio alginolyticus]MDA0408853.1 LysR family transcriptional regulator [Vibrio alginolyticus]
MNRHPEKLLTRLSQSAPMLAAIGEELNFTKAAEKLNIQQSAVSHRVRSLEKALEITLFERTTRKLALTQAGTILCQAASESESIWPKALDKLEQLHSTEHIGLSLSSSLAMKWLIPILSKADTYDLKISLNVSDEHVNFDHENIDVSIRFGIGPYPGLHSVRLSRCVLQPVVNPSLMKTLNGDINSVLSCGQTTLLTDRLGERDNTNFNWQSYFDKREYSEFTKRNATHQFDRADLMLQAAINGIGIALGRTLLIEHDIKSGFLEKIGVAVNTESEYWLVCKPSFAETKRYKRLVRWLKQEVRQTTSQ